MADPYIVSVQRAMEIWENVHGRMTSEQRAEWRQELVGANKELLRYNLGALRRSFAGAQTLAQALTVARTNEHTGY